MTDTVNILKDMIVHEFGIDRDTLDASKPVAEFGLDSLSLGELLFSVEERFDIDIPDDRASVNNLSGLAELVDELTARRGA